MPKFDIGKHTYSTIPNEHNNYFLHFNCQSNIAKIVKSYDQMLHESLDKIFREHCLSSSCQVKEFLRSPQLKSIMKPILDQEPFLSEHFSKEELGKLSLLWISVLAGYNDSAELLVRSGADVNELFGRHNPQVIDEQWNVLYVLLQMYPSLKNVRLIYLVTDHGVDLQARDRLGRTILHYAAKEGRVKTTEMLLEKGADVNAADNEGMTPLYIVANGGCGLNVETPLGTLPDFRKRQSNRLEAELNGNTVMLKTLLKRGANIHLKTIRGRTVLHAACGYVATFKNMLSDNELNVIRLLVSAGADVLAEDCFGKTPFALISTKTRGEPLPVGGESWPLIESLALKKALQPSIKLKDEGIIKTYPGLWYYYLDCFEEIDKMKITNFIETCSFFDLLAKSQCQIAALMQRDPEFETKFRLYDLSGFFSYAEDLKLAFERAQNHYHAKLGCC